MRGRVARALEEDIERRESLLVVAVVGEHLAEAALGARVVAAAREHVPELGERVAARRAVGGVRHAALEHRDELLFVLVGAVDLLEHRERFLVGWEEPQHVLGRADLGRLVVEPIDRELSDLAIEAGRLLRVARRDAVSDVFEHLDEVRVVAGGIGELARAREPVFRGRVAQRAARGHERELRDAQRSLLEAAHLVEDLRARLTGLALLRRDLQRLDERLPRALRAVMLDDRVERQEAALVVVDREALERVGRA